MKANVTDFCEAFAVPFDEITNCFNEIKHKHGAVGEGGGYYKDIISNYQ